MRIGVVFLTFLSVSAIKFLDKKFQGEGTDHEIQSDANRGIRSFSGHFVL